MMMTGKGKKGHYVREDRLEIQNVTKMKFSVCSVFFVGYLTE